MIRRSGSRVRRRGGRRLRWRAAEVERQARAAGAADPRTASWADWAGYFSARCGRLEILYSDVVVGVDAAFAAPTAAGGADPVSEAALASATGSEPTGSVAQVRCDVGVSGGLVVADEAVADDVAPPQASIEDFRVAAAAVADAAARVRPGDTWASWKAHFEPLCGDLAVPYAHLDINVLSRFNWPSDQPDPAAAVTQDLLDAAAASAAGAGRPQIRCEADR